jgi:predicted sulfurtransferase
MSKHIILALYKFVEIPSNSIPTLQNEIESILRSVKTKGTILLATEGINGTICYPQQEAVIINNDDKTQQQDLVLNYLNTHEYFKGLRTRISYADTPVFHRLKVKVKKQIVTMLDGDSDNDEDDNCNVDNTNERDTNLKCTNNIPKYGPTQCINLDPKTVVGQYVKPNKEWDDLLNDPDVVVIDTRNKYEIEIGTFQNAISPNTSNFKQFPDWLHRFSNQCQTVQQQQQKQQEEGEKEESNPVGRKEHCVTNHEPICSAFGTVKSDTSTTGSSSSSNTNTNTNCRSLDPVPEHEMPKVTRRPKAIAMFCTGGVRCEKSTSYALTANVFPPDLPIYHLEGGILAYLENHPNPESSMWKGECFVFDQRVAVSHGLKPSDTYNACHGCRRPISIEDREGEDYVKGVCCKYCKNELTKDKELRFANRQKQIHLAETKGQVHIYDSKDKKVMNEC